MRGEPQSEEKSSYNTLQEAVAYLPTNLRRHRSRVIVGLNEILSADHLFTVRSTLNYSNADPVRLLKNAHVDVLFELLRSALTLRDQVAISKVSNVISRISGSWERMDSILCSYLFEIKHLVLILKAGLQCSAYNECFSFLELGIRLQQQKVEQLKCFEFICSAGKRSPRIYV